MTGHARGAGEKQTNVSSFKKKIYIYTKIRNDFSETGLKVKLNGAAAYVFTVNIHVLEDALRLREEFYVRGT